MAKTFPWMLALSPADRESCAQELVDAARASFATDQPHLPIAELNCGRRRPRRSPPDSAAPTSNRSTMPRPWYALIVAAAKKGQLVPRPPTKGEYEIRFANTDAQKGW